MTIHSKATDGHTPFSANALALGANATPFNSSRDIDHGGAMPGSTSAWLAREVAHLSPRGVTGSPLGSTRSDHGLFENAPLEGVQQFWRSRSSGGAG